jgi:Leucine-rich repeat (LRR) protein
MNINTIWDSNQLAQLKAEMLFRSKLLERQARRFVPCAGTLPDAWCDGASSQLTAINLSNNTLSGSLPKCWSKLASLQYLDLSYNQLSGKLPAEWGSLQHLSTL